MGKPADNYPNTVSNERKAEIFSHFATLAGHLLDVADFLLDPSLGWFGAIDRFYFDQSHFVKDCEEFLGVQQSQYAVMGHPVIVGCMRERARVRGSAAKTLDEPEHEPGEP
ncbi:hypothetical protein GCM10023115_02860 [Pontixanthobacter gangjinensis]|uniref:Uncharacterized protein n=1 Tax=Pontixanthobacter gangjinensis TaxID=1028742 RepID=A0A6I4SIM4_9SPHN|nr:hypothetical protein [Pontixanthobacter gangjinensis]MXO55539.1 hypothetical protein [Pontixanthobacter gangjinensis]